MVLWQDEVVPLELFFNVVEVAYHESVCFVVVWVLLPNVRVVSLDLDWVKVAVIGCGLVSSRACYKEKSERLMR